ncbi:MAG: SpoIIE family protein phosphatase [Planctomycetaceae bacterium]
MAVLTVVRGTNPGEIIPLVGERCIIGRHPNCQVVVDNAAVSRHHSQILENHGIYHLEDLRSRNGTYLNGKLLEGRTKLNEGDQIRLSEVVFAFCSTMPSPLDDETDTPTASNFDGRKSSLPEDDVLKRTIASDATFEESQIFVIPEPFNEPPFDPQLIDELDSSRSGDVRSSLDPEMKLKAVLDIARALGGELRIDKLLPTALEKLFASFPHADQGFILLEEKETGRLRVMATMSRTPTKGGDAVAVSMTVVKAAMESGKALLSADVLDDSRFRNSTSLARMRIRSMMCVPLLDHSGKAIGVIQIVTRNEHLKFTMEDLDMLDAVATQAALAIENARMYAALVEQRDMERDLDFATQIQLGFLPKSKPKFPGYRFADYYEAALRVGGDYFDYVSLPDGRMAMAIGDVAGKGVPAALLMARLYSSTRFQLLTNPTPADAVTGLNEEISSSGLGHRFITFLLMVLNAEKNELTIVNAGHPAPMLRKHDGTVRPIGQEASSLPLGIIPDQIYNSATVSIEPGDVVIAFTDGITEAMSEEKTLYGRERLNEYLSAASQPIDLVVKGLVEDAEAFAGGTPNRDDTCIVGMHRSLT